MAIKFHHQSFIDATNTDEERAALELEERFKQELAGYTRTKGDIYILSSITIFGQEKRDIDLLVLGFLDNFEYNKKFQTKNCGIVDSLEIKSFIFNIELKSHPIDKISKEGTAYLVSYKGSGRHNASRQCDQTKFSLLNHITAHLNDIHSPFICDFLWFNGITKNQLDQLRGGMIDNALHNNFSFREMITAALQQANVKNEEGADRHYVLDAFPDGKHAYKRIINLFAEKRTARGLTKGKFELLSQKSIDIDQLKENAGNKMAIISGRAGTGKTIQLLQLAFHLADTEHNNRCLILTYNRALVSDIQRLIDFTPMPSRVDGRTVSIRTIHSFFQSLMFESGVITSNLNPNEKNYTSLYEKGLKELHSYIINKCNKEDIEILKDTPEQVIDWDYVLIDEAQDFEDIEKEVLFKIYGPNRIIVADGVDQFMRSNKRQDWGKNKNIKKDNIYKPKAMTLERRQKSNLVRFVNAFAEEAGIEWKVQAQEKLAGGKIIIENKYTSTLHHKLKVNCKNNDCENYDILILVPPQLVNENGFIKKENYKNANIKIFDGTDSNKETMYPTKDECRLFQYDSCRGLEGWCVVCDQFDELYRYKMDTYKDDNTALGFDREIAKQKSVFLWMLMPLTRPIDTLVITLKDPESEIGKMLKKLADNFSDFVDWNIK